MKIIVAGSPKTGTKTVAAALRELDYEVYEFMDHFWYHEKEWKKIFSKGGSINDFKQMYQDIDVVTDGPSYLFWEEIHKAFPEAKIILMVRDEDSWCESALEQYRRIRNHPGFIISCFTPIGWKMSRFLQMTIMAMHGVLESYPVTFNSHLNEMVLRKSYRQHTQYCLQNAPKDKLLVYNIETGWEPLCIFLGKDIPEKSFPHKSKQLDFVDDRHLSHPYTNRVQRELLIVLCLLVVIIAFGVYDVAAIAF
ncbi:uncharacterized protein LOC143459583 [Clavelina lepadiformis]|uniref:uncharacterized protein LOC143459583 n=1 Tax=Clavelina lepadiformis TaxID=159417 RepID=UPI004041210F